MKLSELTALYDGEILFSIREVVDEEEKILISCKSGEQMYLLAELQDRNVGKIRIETDSRIEGVRQIVNAIFVIVLEAEEEPETNNDPTNDPTNDPSGDPTE